MVALRLLQLKTGRDDTTLPASLTFTTPQQQCLQQLASKLQGRTRKQQNPDPPTSLPWAAWLTARLGGWSGYHSQSPPGIRTLSQGLRKFGLNMPTYLKAVANAMDKIYVNDIRAFGYSGALPAENVLGQWFRVDLKLQLDLSAAGRSDVLADTYNYAVAIATVQQLIQQRPFNLVEALASEIAKAVLSTDDRLSQVAVRLTKLTPPVPNFAGNIAVEITRDRQHLDTVTPTPLDLS